MKFLLLTLLTFSAFSQTPKNLIFIVGDGMGLSSIAGTRVYYQGADGKLNIEKFKTIGLSKTHSTNDYTTDSAAGATAFSTGQKTYNGAVAVDTKQKPLKTIFDIALKRKKSIGIVTTTSVTHATPASFYAHAKKRSEEHNIASQVKDSQLDFLLGGGSKYLDKEREALKKRGWDIIETKKQMLDYKNKKPVLGIFTKKHLEYSINDKKGLQLIDMVKFGLKRLKKNKNGYMFLIEAGRIDHASHANLAKEHFGEVMALDRTVQYLFDNVNLKDTLIVLTADHETGGLTLSGYGDLKKVKGDAFASGSSSKTGVPFISWATGPAALSDLRVKSTYSATLASHTTVDVPVYSIGAGHEKMGGFMNNNEIPHKILKVMKLDPLK